MDNRKNGIIEANRTHTAILPDGTEIPRLGQGTWHLGESSFKRRQEIETLQLGVQLGMMLIDTAEMYGEGTSEKLIGEAIQNIPRERLFLVSKVYPHNAGHDHIFESCKDTLQRMGVLAWICTCCTGGVACHLPKRFLAWKN